MLRLNVKKLKQRWKKRLFIEFSDSKRADIKGMTAPILNTSKKDTKNEKLLRNLNMIYVFWLNIFQSLVMFKKINCSFIFFPKKSSLSKIQEKFCANI